MTWVLTMEYEPFPVDFGEKSREPRVNISGSIGKWVNLIRHFRCYGFDTSLTHLLGDAVSDEDLDGSNLRRQSSQSSDGGAENGLKICGRDRTLDV